MKSYSLTDNKNNLLDKKLDKLFKEKKNGIFIELGANDGLAQSNTAFFEFNRNWKGILIEPSIIAYEKCKLNRPNSICINCACVDNLDNNLTIMGDFLDGNLMSSVNGNRLDRKNLSSVKANTLENILDETLKKTFGSNEIDFLSLDTEGFELIILKGLNLNKYSPKYLLIEIYNKDYTNITEYLKLYGYILHSNFSNYNKNDNPFWDGTHNDYLFIKTEN